MDLLKRIDQAAEYIRAQSDVNDAIGVVLGTGLGGFVNEMHIRVSLPYAQIPNFPLSTVQGHEGKLIIGELAGKSLVVMQGRFHFYEGYSMEDVVFPIRVMRALGISTLLLSNASGGMNPDFEVGDIMAIRDHINLFQSNPLIGKNIDTLGPRFPDMSEPYDLQLFERMQAAAAEIGLKLKSGVYAGVSGPCFETPAEYKYLRIIGADAVGMSTVPETIAAKHMGMKVVALSVITDLGIEGHVEKVSHEEVQAAAQLAEPKMLALVTSFLSNLDVLTSAQTGD